ncbi:MAG: hypothetical protein AAGD38_16255 [Acidobacteriota bacterium]
MSRSWLCALALVVLASSSAAQDVPVREDCSPRDFAVDDATLTDAEDLPCWDWMEPRTYTLRSTSGEREVPLPFHDPTFACRGMDNPPDVDPADGWVALYRRLGDLTPVGSGSGVPLASFALYNRHRGLLRYFFFPLGTMTQDSFTTGLVELSIRTDRVEEIDGEEQPRIPALWAPLLARDPEGAAAGRGTLREFRRAATLSQAFLPRNDAWNCVTFVLPGYDPLADRREDLVLGLDVFGVVEGTLDLAGTLRQPGTQPMMESSSADAFSELGDRFSLAAESYSSATGWFDKTSEWARGRLGAAAGGAGGTAAADADPDFDVVGNFARAVEQVDELGVIPIIGTVAGVLDFFSGGEKGPSFVTVQGDVALQGTVKTRKTLGAVSIRLPGSRDVGEFVNQPLYDLRLGVFNLVDIPKAEVVRDWRLEGEVTSRFDGANEIRTHCGELHFRRDRLRLKAPLSFAINPDAEVAIERIEAAWVPLHGVVADDDYLPLEVFNEGVVELEVNQRTTRLCRTVADWTRFARLNPLPAPVLPRQLDVRVVFRAPGDEPSVIKARYDVDFKLIAPTPELPGFGEPWFTVERLEAANRALFRSFGTPVERIVTLQQGAAIRGEFLAAERVEVDLVGANTVVAGDATLTAGEEVRIQGSFLVRPGASLVLETVDPTATSVRFTGDRLPRIDE